MTLLHKVLEWFDEFNQPPVPSKTWMKCQLAVAEAFTNVVRHAHKALPPETPIDLEVCILSESIEIRLWDNGPGLDITSLLQKIKKNPPGPGNPGGRGWMLLDLISDKMSYSKTEDGRNCLFILKNYEK